LTRREHSRRELEEKLIRKGCAAEMATQVAASLEVERLLSDDRFVEMLIRARRRRGYGPVRIRGELREKGIADDVIARWLDVGSHDWTEEVKRVRRQKYGAGIPANMNERAKQARFLQYRGFTFDQIQQALNPRGRDEAS
jgi:regulatory protein